MNYFQGLFRPVADQTNWDRTIALVNCKLCSFAGVSSLGWFSGNVREGYHCLYKSGSYFIKQYTVILEYRLKNFIQSCSCSLYNQVEAPQSIMRQSMYYPTYKYIKFLSREL